jgi:hypothetical protein
MKIRWLVVCAPLLGCGGDDITYGPADGGREAGSFDGTFPDAPTLEGGPSDGGADAPLPPRLLLTMNGTSASELVALNVGTHAVDGRLPFPGNLGTTFARGDDPWLLGQRADFVAKLDRAQPWRIVSSWAVALDDKKEGGAAYSDPYAVLVSAANKGYVLRYTRNKIAVIDATQLADAGAPLKTIDLSMLVQPQDKDGVVEMTAGFYLADRHTIYVLLANIDRTLVATDGFTILCAPTTETLIGIDVTTDQITSLGGTGPGGGIALAGYNPSIGLAGPAAVYDATNQRILVVHAGCNTPLADGGAGTVTKRVIEEVTLGGQTKVLLDASAKGYPGAFSYIGPHDAVVGFGSDALRWDPTQSTLGSPIANAPDSFAFVYDGQGSLLGTRATFLADGGTTLQVVKTLIADGGASTLATNPFTDNTGFMGGVELWP